MRKDIAMYLHIGNGYVIKKDDVIGIFDLDITSQSKRTREFLNAAEKGGQVINAAGDEIPKSFVVGSYGGKQSVFLSLLNSSTLLRRSNQRIME